MVNTLYLPELREMLAQNNDAELREFCTALHPARTADFMEGLSADESWRVLKHADSATRVEIFSFFERPKQVEIIETQDRDEVASLIAEMAPDDRVDLLGEVAPEVVEELLARVPAAERRDILRLSSYPEGTAGAIMTSDAARLSERLTVHQALDELRRQAEGLETIYDIFVVDEENHLRGQVSARTLLSKMGKPDVRLRELMETELVTANVMDDQEEVARKVARYDLSAIPVVDDENRIVGIITHDDVIDVLHEEAAEDVQRMGGVSPLEMSYMQTPLVTLSWKRGMWLAILFITALLTAFALSQFEGRLHDPALTWLVVFIPLVISTGGNSGNQAATLVISALSTSDVFPRDWLRVLRRELLIGLLLGGGLAALSFFIALIHAPNVQSALVLPLTVLLVVLSGATTGAMLPLIFKRLGLDPALMSNPFVACIMDILGIMIYMNVGMFLLTRLSDK
jgi:magnesium transporter